jgi:hypothetical protein
MLAGVRRLAWNKLGHERGSTGEAIVAERAFRCPSVRPAALAVSRSPLDEAEPQRSTSKYLDLLKK